MYRTDTCDKFARAAPILWHIRRWLIVTKIPRFTVAVDDNNAYVTYHTLTLAWGILRHEEKADENVPSHWAFLLLATLLVLSGCNTVRGMGQDIEQGGEAIQRSAD